MSQNSQIQSKKIDFKAPVVHVPIVGFISFFITFIATLFIKMDAVSSTRALLILSFLFAWMTGLVFAALMSWIGAAKNFFSVLSSRSPDASLKNAGPINSLYVFSDAYLNERGRLARSRLKQYLLLFISIVLLGGGLYALVVSNITI